MTGLIYHTFSYCLRARTWAERYLNLYILVNKGQLEAGLEICSLLPVLPNSTSILILSYQDMKIKLIPGYSQPQRADRQLPDEINTLDYLQGSNT